MGTKKCSHKHIELVSLGGWHYQSGDAPWEDFRDVYVCQDCGKIWDTWAEVMEDTREEDNEDK